jgi:hypothetical protein
MKLAQITKPNKFRNTIYGELSTAASRWEPESRFVTGKFSRKLPTVGSVNQLNHNILIPIEKSSLNL